MKLGKLQSQFLAGMVLGRFLIVPNEQSRALCRRGLMRENGAKGGFVGVTAAGLRWLADEMDAGRIENKPNLPERKDAPAEAPVTYTAAPPIDGHTSPEARDAIETLTRAAGELLRRQQ